MIGRASRKPRRWHKQRSRAKLHALRRPYLTEPRSKGPNCPRRTRTSKEHPQMLVVRLR
jgi:hypothetical protein